MRYHDRRHVGEDLALRLMEWAADGDLVEPLVLALPRGGVPVAAQVARALRAPLDVLVARKIGVPGRPETGIGAIVGDDPPLYDRRALEMLGLSEDRLGSDVARERTELHRRESRYRGDRPAPRVADRAVIVVDDGLVTGVTARGVLVGAAAQMPLRHAPVLLLVAFFQLFTAPITSQIIGRTAYRVHALDRRRLFDDELADRLARDGTPVPGADDRPPGGQDADR